MERKRNETFSISNENFYCQCTFYHNRSWKLERVSFLLLKEDSRLCLPLAFGRDEFISFGNWNSSKGKPNWESVWKKWNSNKKMVVNVVLRYLLPERDQIEKITTWNLRTTFTWPPGQTIFLEEFISFWTLRLRLHYMKETQDA